MSRFFASCVALCSLVGFLTTASVQGEAPLRLGGEFIVNSYTTGDQSYPFVAVDPSDGDFVVVWVSGNDGSSNGVFGRRFDSAGVAQGSQFQVNAYTSDSQARPAVSMNATGAFVVVWQSNGQDGGSYGVFGRRFSAAGAPQASEFQLSTYTAAVQASPRVALEQNGVFVVAFDSNLQDGSGYGVFARRFDAAGGPIGVEFQVNVITAGHQNRPAVAADQNGDFVIAWEGSDGVSAFSNVFARRFDSAGVAQGQAFVVDSYTSTGQGFAAVAMQPSGEFVVAWDSLLQDGSLYGLFGRRFDSSGAAQGAEFQVNTYTLLSQHGPTLGVDAVGRFVVAWRSLVQDGFSYGIFGRRFGSDGAAIGSELQVNTYTSGSQTRPTLSVERNGNFVVTWDSDGQDGAGTGIVAQRFASPKVLDIDGDGRITALTDGLLVLRFMFGFTGATLTAGAVDVASCTRCDGGAIQGYLQSLI